MFIPRKILEDKLNRMLAEDLGQGDITSTLLVPEDCVAVGEIKANEKGVAAGIEEAKLLLESLGLKVEVYVNDGDEVKPKQVLIRVSGDARTMLSTERTVLNVVSRMSGIATATRKLVEKIRKAGCKAKVACTRKTAPGLLYFDKKAVSIGGGDPHRFHLDDMILIKDNHVAIIGSVEKAVQTAKKKASFSKKVEVEVSRVDDVLTAAKAGADIVMLDNFSPEQVDEAVRFLKKAGFYGKVLIEASGGITAENILDFASKEVDIISLGEITHSVKALNVSLEVTNVERVR
ncbi:MAG: carboxylating nicotinate-nucleotide diphosphorylase [Candidatus Bathyarchaeia archaeon]